MLRPTVLLAAAALFQSSAPAPRLHLEQVLADSTSYDVNAVLIVGPHEALLWDAQYHLADARRLADAIAATGKHLKAIVISHADHDHYSGAAVIVERFPGTPVYMTPKALAEFKKTYATYFAGEKARKPELMADSVVIPAPLPSTHLTVDGAAVEVIPDLQGDVLEPSNSVLWIPSLKAVLAGDVVFNGVHPWLAASTPESRAAWQGSLKRIAGLKPRIVIAGHKRPGLADSPAAVDAMAGYLRDFDAVRQQSSGYESLVATMKQKYPEWAVPGLLQYSAMTAFAATPKAAGQQHASSSPAAPGAWDPTGSYRFTIQTPQQPLQGQFTISRSGAGFGGNIGPVGVPPVPIDSIELQDKALKLAFVIPAQGPVSMDLTRAGPDSLAGKMTGPHGSQDVSARKVHQ
jgi:glyoxylase-like metal-dependent hydrolase (beta-lactamase superfamily II)